MPLALRIALWRLRHVGVALLVLVAACLVARQLAPPPEPTRPVVVAASDLPAGHELAAADLRTVAMPARAVAARPPTADSLVGRHVTVDVPEGLPLVPALLDGARFGLAPPEGTVTVPVRLADPAVADLLRPGDRVDLVAPGDASSFGTVPTQPDPTAAPGGASAGPVDGPTVLAAAALVLGVPDREHDDGALGGLTGGVDDAAPLVMVAVAPDEGRRLAACAQGSVGAVLVEGS